MVARTGLLDRIATVEPPVISVIAPTGYGKTTLLAQCVERAAPRAAWVTADERDNDPMALLMTVAAALDRIDPLPPDGARGAGGPPAVHTVMARLHTWVGAIASRSRSPSTMRTR